MIDWKMYGKIQELKREGLNKSQVARRLNIDYKTVLKYWDMAPDDYSAERGFAENRTCKAAIFKEYILKCLIEYPDMSSAQLYDWLKEKTGQHTLPFTERTMRNYVTRLRVEYDIQKPSRIRQYEVVDELPMGYQAQVDMGSINLKTYQKKSKKLYCFAMVLSHSRYKFILWSDKPFNTTSFIQAHISAFNFFGGRPQEVVYDQDRVMAVSENYGDIIFTEQFQNFIDQIKFKIYLCRGSDPESKGKIENVVKYAKHGFAEHRTFYDIQSFNDDCIAWLYRTGNGTENDSTKKIPAEVFATEKEYLLPVSEYTFVNSSAKSILYSVRKDNVILYKSNKYRVPKGTYFPGRKVALRAANGELTIIDPDTGEIIAVHTISLEKGRIIGERTKHEGKSETAIALEAEIKKLFKNPARIDDFLKQVELSHRRYYKDQLYQIKKLFDVYTAELLLKALDYCMLNALYSYESLKLCTESFSEAEKDAPRQKINAALLPEKYRADKTILRSLSVYEDALNRGGAEHGKY